MNRIELIQSILDKTNFCNYLEIGTLRGDSFLPVVCKNKIAVDPAFRISFIKRLKWEKRNPSNKQNRYYKMTSDSFFDKVTSKEIEIDRIDIALIDGMHTFAYSLRDVFNCLKYLNKNGIIVMHDCLPPRESAAIPIDYSTKEGMKELNKIRGEWCGDVWKTIAYLRECHSDILESFVIDTDFGLGIVRPRAEFDKPPEIKHVEFERVFKIGYREMIASIEQFLGIKPDEYCSQLISEF